MDETSEHHARQLAAALMQDEANRLAMLDWAHPSWLEALPGELTAATRGLAAWAPRWLELLGIPPMPFDALRGDAAVLTALPIERALRVTRLRALWPRRAELRHWIDRERRTRLCAWVGPAAAEALRRASTAALAGAAWLRDAPALEGMSDDALAWDGYCLFALDGVWADAGALPLVRVALSRHATVSRWVAGYRPATSANDSAAVFAHIPLIVSEDA